MRRLDETPIDPEAAALLDAIDATLAGEPVDPRHADLAELTVLLAAARPQPTQQFTAALDERVARRFATARAPRSRLRRAWLWAPAGALASAIVVAAIVVSTGSQTTTQNTFAASSPQRTASSNGSTSSAASSPAPPSPAAKLAPGTASTSTPSPTPPPSSSTGAGASSSSAGSTGGARGVAAGSPTGSANGVALAPPPNGRKIIQSAQLALGTAPSRIDTVAQEVFDVVGQENGIVQNSTVTASAAPGAYAQFQLSVPSSSLARTMASLSTLRYARVSSRTDATQDVNDQYNRDVQKLADARALRTSLLKQLANATTQAQINSLTAQIHDAEASISSDQATLRQLQHQISYSQITLTINTPMVVAVPSKSNAFTLTKASHDAGRVLTVAAGVALIALAALVPIAMVGALGWSIAIAVRRRRREQALDLV